MAELSFDIKANYREVMEAKRQVENLKAFIDTLSLSAAVTIDGNSLKRQIKDITDQLNKVAGDLQKNLSGITSSINGASSSLGGMSNPANSLASSLSNATAAAGNMRGSMRGLRDSLSGVNGPMDSLTNSVMRFAQQFTVGAMTYQALTSAIGTFKQAIGTITSYTAANSTLGAILGVSSDELETFIDSSQRLGRTTVFTASQVTELQIALSKLGFSGDQIHKMEEDVLSFAQATGANLADAASTAGAVLRMFGKDASDVGNVVGALSAATMRSALDFRSISDNIAQFGPVAHSMGFALEDALTLFGELKNAGIDGSVAATSLRNIFNEMAGGKLLKQLGYQVTNIETFVQALNDLQGAGYAGAEGVKKAMDAIGKRGGAQFLALINSKDHIEELNEQIKVGANSGTTQGMASRMTNNLAGSMKMMQSAWEGFILQFRKADGIMKDVVDGITQGIGDLREFISGGSDFTRSELEGIINTVKALVASFAVFKGASYLKDFTDGLTAARLEATATAEAIARSRTDIYERGADGAMKLTSQGTQLMDALETTKALEGEAIACEDNVKAWQKVIDAKDAEISIARDNLELSMLVGDQTEQDTRRKELETLMTERANVVDQQRLEQKKLEEILERRSLAGKQLLLASKKADLAASLAETKAIFGKTTATAANTVAVNANSGSKLKGVAASLASTAAHIKDTAVVSMQTAAYNIATIAVRTFNASMMMMPYVAIAAAIAGIAYAIYKIGFEADAADRMQQKLNDTLRDTGREVNKPITEAQAKMAALQTLAKSGGKTSAEYRKLYDELRSAMAGQGIVIEQEIYDLEELNKHYGEYIQNLQREAKEKMKASAVQALAEARQKEIDDAAEGMVDKISENVEGGSIIAVTLKTQLIQEGEWDEVLAKGEASAIQYARDKVQKFVSKMEGLSESDKKLIENEYMKFFESSMEIRQQAKEADEAILKTVDSTIKASDAASSLTDTQRKNAEANRLSMLSLSDLADKMREVATESSKKHKMHINLDFSEDAVNFLTPEWMEKEIMGKNYGKETFHSDKDKNQALENANKKAANWTAIAEMANEGNGFIKVGDKTFSVKEALKRANQYANLVQKLNGLAYDVTVSEDNVETAVETALSEKSATDLLNELGDVNSKIKQNEEEAEAARKAKVKENVAKAAKEPPTKDEDPEELAKADAAAKTVLHLKNSINDLQTSMAAFNYGEFWAGILGDLVTLDFSGAWKKVTKGWEDTCTAFSSSWDIVKTAFSAEGRSLMVDSLDDVWKGISDGCARAGDEIADFFTGIGDFFTGFGVWIADTDFAKSIQDVWNGAIGTLEQLPDDMWNALPDGARNAITDSIATIENGWNSATAYISNSWETATNAISSTFTEAWNGLTNGITSGWKSTVSYVQDKWEGFVSLFGVKYNKEVVKPIDESNEKVKKLDGSLHTLSNASFGIDIDTSKVKDAIEWVKKLIKLGKEANAETGNGENGKDNGRKKPASGGAKGSGNGSKDNIGHWKAVDGKVFDTEEEAKQHNADIQKIRREKAAADKKAKQAKKKEAEDNVRKREDIKNALRQKVADWDELSGEEKEALKKQVTERRKASKDAEDTNFFAELEDKIKEKNKKNSGKTNPAETARKEQDKYTKAQEDVKREREDALRKIEEDIADARVSAMWEGSDKYIKGMENAKKKELAKLKKDNEERLRKWLEQDRKLHEANPTNKGHKGTVGTSWDKEKAKQTDAYKAFELKSNELYTAQLIALDKKYYDEAISGYETVSQKKTKAYSKFIADTQKMRDRYESNQKIINGDYSELDESIKGNSYVLNGYVASLKKQNENLLENLKEATRQYYKEETESMYENFREYGTLQQKRLAITLKYDEDIRKARESGNAWEVASLEKKRDAENESLKLEAFKQSPLYSIAMSNNANLDKSALVTLRNQMEALMSEAARTGMPPQELTAYASAIADINKRIIEKNPFKALKESAKLADGAIIALNETTRKLQETYAKYGVADGEAQEGGILDSLYKDMQSKREAALADKQALESAKFTQADLEEQSRNATDATVKADLDKKIEEARLLVGELSAKAEASWTQSEQATTSYTTATSEIQGAETEQSLALETANNRIGEYNDAQANAVELANQWGDAMANACGMIDHPISKLIGQFTKLATTTISSIKDIKGVAAIGSKAFKGVEKSTNGVSKALEKTGEATEAVSEGAGAVADAAKDGVKAVAEEGSEALEDLGGAVKSTGDGIKMTGNAVNKAIAILAIIQAAWEIVQTIISLVTGNAEKHYEERIGAMEAKVKTLDYQLQNLRETLDDMWGTAALEQYAKTLDTLKAKEEAMRKKNVAADSGWGKSHSFGYYVGEKYGKDSQEAQFLNRLRNSTSKEAYELLNDARYQQLIANIRSVTDGQIDGEEWFEQWKEYADLSRDEIDLIEQEFEKINGITLDGLKDEFKSLVQDADRSFARISESWDSFMREGVYGRVRTAFDKELESIGDELDKANKAYTAGTMTSEQYQATIKAIKERYVNASQEAQTLYQQSLDLLNISLNDSQNATANGITNITADQADQLVGRITAIQIAVEAIKAIMEMRGASDAVIKEVEKKGDEVKQEPTLENLKGFGELVRPHIDVELPVAPAPPAERELMPNDHTDTDRSLMPEEFVQVMSRAKAQGAFTFINNDEDETAVTEEVAIYDRALASIEGQVVTLNTTLSELGVMGSEANSIADDTRSILAQSFIELQQIRDNTETVIKPIKAIASDLSELKTIMDNKF